MRDDFTFNDGKKQQLSEANDEEKPLARKKAGKVGSNDFGGKDRKKLAKEEKDDSSKEEAASDDASPK